MFYKIKYKFKCEKIICNFGKFLTRAKHSKAGKKRRLIALLVNKRESKRFEDKMKALKKFSYVLLLSAMG